MLTLASSMKLPVESVTQTFAILAKRGAGKSYTASVIAEEMLKSGQQIIAVDPTGAWWGLRSKFPVVIFGGEHADIPLEESAGEIIAKSLVENRFPAVIDLSLFRKGAAIRFMLAFAETLYRLNREAVHLFVDEADAVAPQQRYQGGDENRMLGAMEDIVRRGRKRGIGCTLITQRPAVLNKNVLTQCEVLVALRMVHPKDIDAVKEWVNVHGDPATAKKMIESLPSLPIGNAWFWCPAWDLFQRAEIRSRETFDSGATPKPGQAEKKPKQLAKIDLTKLGEQIKATVEKAKADDPKELRRRIAELERQLKERPAEQIEVEKIVEVPVLKNGQLDRTEKISERLETIVGKVTAEVAELRRLIAPASAPRPTPRTQTSLGQSAMKTAPVAAKKIPREVSEHLTKTQQRILDVIATLNARGIQPNRDCVARWQAIHPNGGRYGSDLAHLREQGFLNGFQLTAAGLAVAAINVTGPSGVLDALQEGTQKKLFATILENDGEAYVRDTLAAKLEIHPNGGRYGSDLAWLRTMGVITERGPITVTEGALR